MQFQRFDHRYQLRFMSGERFVATLLDFCRREGIGYAAMSGLGAVSAVSLAYFNDETQEYETHEIAEQLEVIGLTGNITIKDGGPFAHVHATFGDRDLKGLNGKIEVRRVVCADRPTGRPINVAAPYVGREEELELLQNIFSRVVRDRRAQLVTIFGDPGIGKSLLTVDLAARLSRGGSLPGGSTAGRPHVILLLNAEDDAADSIRPRAEAAGADLDRVIVVSSAGRAPLTLPAQLAELEELIRTHHVDLVVIDPVVALRED